MWPTNRLTVVLTSLLTEPEKSAWTLFWRSKNTIHHSAAIEGHPLSTFVTSVITCSYCPGVRVGIGAPEFRSPGCVAVRARDAYKGDTIRILEDVKLSRCLIKLKNAPRNEKAEHCDT
jgi:hypothetical protein